ncbi:pex2/pex12 domain-containing protein [Hirsutella rhossiliensis]|uniref:Peroxisome assembly protein 12 n=1 Tax=Hirsutella rhossiliensis TaxID=111463 RepID=A0A9P8N4V3_9HYPO|nr:pex2/pex12 domain-containing protein [Hirsutella rhossiliensis]KAH0965834.1 pex2/pex12 domain-containing protein [Hirsutella rhossiliensis]
MEFITALRGTLDDGKPSLFEVLSEQQLNNLLPPTLRYLLTIATQRHPRYLLRILNSFDELYALSMLLVERHYLSTRGGSFTENFYGLKREKALRGEIPRASLAAPHLVRDTLKLTTADVWKNLAVLVALPYCKRRLDEAYEVNAPRALLGAAYTRMPDNPTVGDRFLHYYRWFLRNLYPGVNAAYYFAMLAFNLAYLFDRTKYHNPFMWLIGTRLRRMTRADYQAIESLTDQSKATARAGPRSIFSPSALVSRALSSLSMLLPMSIFALKFLEWWHQSDFAKQLSRKATEHIDLPPPVLSSPRSRCTFEKGVGETNALKSDEAHDADLTAQDAPTATPSMLPIFVVRAPQDASACPICQGEIVTPTACQTGVVFCYSCIHKWLEGSHPRQESFMESRAAQWESGQGRCAVTGKRVLGGTQGLRRIMVGLASWMSPGEASRTGMLA